MLDRAFARIAGAVSTAFAGPYHPGRLTWAGAPVKDAGGSITAPGASSEYDCRVQVDRVTEAMRAETGFRQRDVRLIILAPDLAPPVDTAATVTILSGPHAGDWSIESASGDALGFAYDGRGRRA